MPQEGKLPETAPHRPLALTIGAAAVTLVVVIGILTGPSVIDCFGGPDNAGMCLRDKLGGAGFAPSAATAPESESDQATAEAEAVAPDVEGVPAEADQVEDLVAATFGLLRAEPDGSVVIAGSGTPGSEVEVYADEELIGRTTVEESGDWVLVPAEPIEPGGREITLAEAGKDGRADQSFVVVIDPERDSQPLVVASEPGEASEILQGLERPEPMQVASVPEEAGSGTKAALEPARPQASPTEANSADTEPVADAPAASDAPPAPALAPVSEGPSTTADPQVPAAAGTPLEPVSEPALTPAPAGNAPAEPESAVGESEGLSEGGTGDIPESGTEDIPEEVSGGDQPTARVASAAPGEPAPASEPVTPDTVAEPEAVAAVAAPAESTAEPLATTVPVSGQTTVPPTIDAIEIDGDRTFFAGAGPDGATMRLYVDDVFIADVRAQGGRWLIEAGDILPGPQHSVRIDMLAANSADVAARAEVDFRVDIPARSTAVAEASATGQQSAGSEGGQPSIEPAAQQSDPQVSATAGSVRAPADIAPASGSGATESQGAAGVAKPADDDAVPTMVAQPVGDPELQRFASGRAIIRRGDNLWTIARRVYGQGIRYTTIYEANTAQIRDPDWIYPGQVFDLPESEQ